MTFIERRQRVTDTSGVLVLLELTAPSLGATLRLVNDTKDWVSNGHTYTGFPFRFKLPDDTTGQSPRAVLEIDNVGREMTADLEAMQPGELMTAVVSIADRADPETIYQTFRLPVSVVSVNQQVATAQLGVDTMMRHAASKLRYTPFVSPGIF